MTSTIRKHYPSGLLKFMWKTKESDSNAVDLKNSVLKAHKHKSIMVDAIYVTSLSFHFGYMKL